MRVADVVGFAGHEVHVCRYREARALLRWLGPELRGVPAGPPLGVAVPSAEALPSGPTALAPLDAVAVPVALVPASM